MYREIGSEKNNKSGSEKKKKILGNKFSENIGTTDNKELGECVEKRNNGNLDGGAGGKRCAQAKNEK